MNGTRAEASRLVQDILGGLPAESHTEVAVCPPFILIPLVAEKLIAGGLLTLGAQNLSGESVGAFTGEISGLMLRDYGCKYVIVGHSERRSLYGEDDETVARKFAAALEQGLTPILCVGETLTQREADETEKVIARQVQAVLERNGIKAFARAVVAYEPVWAIGTGRTATPQQAQRVHAFIRGRLASADRPVADDLRILYGGSVKGANAAELFREPDIDGGLIGGASLKAAEFLAICQAAATSEG
ncbi:MAG: triose-phosphate isomerase, partial [Acidiferrobacterales bacterium]|nr:triose-phosphate isomerase [Acidiferrobacterales bacterium]